MTIIYLLSSTDEANREQVKK